MVGKKQILNGLSEIIDPELGISIVDLGLIYEVKIEKAKRKTGNSKPATGNRRQEAGKLETAGAHVEVKMTLTSIGCPLAGFFAMQVEEKIKQMKGVKDVHVHIVWEPPWTPERMSKKAKATLGFK